MPTKSSLWLALAGALVLACGGGGEVEEGTTTETTRAVEEAPPPPEEEAAVPELEFTPVDLPESFPSDFPIAPQSTVTSATSQSDPSGVISSITIMSTTPPREQFDWYRDALAQAGWTIATEGQSGQSRSLYAQQGESYVDLTVSPYGQGDWTQTDAVVWMAQS